MRLIKSFLLPLILLTIISACDVSPDNSDEKKFLAAIIYDSKTSAAESIHLSSLDQSKLTEVERQAVIVRIEDLGEIDKLLDGNDFIVGVNRCLPGRLPPAPCPVDSDLFPYVPEGTRIDLDLFGVYMDIPENPDARISQDVGNMQLTSVDGKDVFANGILNTYDKLFRTAWYHFDVKSPELAKQSLILKIQTVIISKQEVQYIAIEIPIAAGTFLTE